MKKLTKYGLTEKEIERILVKRYKPKIRKLNALYKDCKEVKIGIVSDTHLGSKYEDVQALHSFYELAEHEGVSCVLHAGDIIQGERLYRGWEYETHTFGADAQVNYVKEIYPQNLKTYFITGNHDLSYWKSVGVDIGDLLDSENLIYLGQLQADIKIGGAKFRLMHPDGGGAYALSYKAQKIAEQIASGQKPNVLILGHWHTIHYFYYRNINIFNAGSFQKQTPWLMRKGINTTIGGWIITFRFQKGKSLGIDPKLTLFPH